MRTRKDIIKRMIFLVNPFVSDFFIQRGKRALLYEISLFSQKNFLHSECIFVYFVYFYTLWNFLSTNPYQLVSLSHLRPPRVLRWTSPPTSSNTLPRPTSCGYVETVWSELGSGVEIPSYSTVVALLVMGISSSHRSMVKSPSNDSKKQKPKSVSSPKIQNTHL